MYVFLLPVATGLASLLINARAAALKRDTIETRRRTEALRKKRSASKNSEPTKEEPRVVPEEPVVVPYHGSLTHYYDEVGLMEQSISASEVDEFVSCRVSLEEFLCSCASEEELEVQHALILLLTVRNSIYGFNTSFPRDPFWIDLILEESASVLINTVSKAALNTEQKFRGDCAAKSLVLLVKNSVKSGWKQRQLI